MQGGFLLKIEGIILLIYILFQYFLQRKGSRTALVIVSLTAIIAYLSQYITAYHAMIGAKWITDKICEMSDLTQIVVMIGIVEVIFIILIQRMFTNHSFDTNKRVWTKPSKLPARLYLSSGEVRHHQPVLSTQPGQEGGDGARRGLLPAEDRDHHLLPGRIFGEVSKWASLGALFYMSLLWSTITH